MSGCKKPGETLFWAIYMGIISAFISIYNDRRDPHQAAQRRTLGGRSMSEASLPVVDGVQSNQKIQFQGWSLHHFIYD